MSYIFTFLFSCVALIGFAQTNVTALDFENRPNTSDWWKDNKDIKFTIDTKARNQINPKSKACLKVSWDQIPETKAWTWFTDIKIDTFATKGMKDTWLKIKKEPWISFWCNTGKHDTVWIQILVLTDDHIGKWGSKKMFPVHSEKWQMVKIKLSSLEYENWGKAGNSPDFEKDNLTKFELGLRNGASKKSGKIEARFDNIQFTDYEP